ncbi:flagellar hook-length control protein FliK [Niallia taxi]|uniref:flagellar hook-length control protein FliK n=1 Tax=Niallia taxi TaxID=2499688 RepID=UPI0015F5893B|nr:flagellar hook-length control protein FliK [Niallia taxi]
MGQIAINQTPAVSSSSVNAPKSVSNDKVQAFFNMMSLKSSKAETVVDQNVSAEEQSADIKLEEVISDIEKLEEKATELSEEELALQLVSLLSKIESLIEAYGKDGGSEGQTNPEQAVLKNELKLLSQLLSKSETVMQALKSETPISELEDMKGFEQLKDIIHALQNKGKNEGQSKLLDFIKDNIAKDIKEISTQAPQEPKPALRMQNVVQINTRVTDKANDVMQVATSISEEQSVTAPATENLSNGKVSNGNTAAPISIQPTQQIQTQATMTTTQTDAASPTPVVRITHLIEDMRAIISRQMRSGMDLDGATLKIKVVPRSLGEIDIRLTTTDGKLTAELVATSSQAKDVLEAQANTLKQTLIQQGFNVDKIEIGQADSAFSGQKEREQVAHQQKKNSGNVDFVEAMDEATEEDIQSPESVISYRA